uniref:Trafficking protein particle complex subunit n=2 Tax=Craspedostauros australis TaxID=1486917 RepID=A0A7R9ZSH6_9STRA|mmetsp:Transcript_8505/g.23000  ORF Transcript_8505/g.23000 Transcript_8505/m.23000 type:complete len:205 (+) Transcript_8505:96-710(+)|eukprot:CAMPEP_0198130120 /NCGR_PEP_ID=MMETSP1442-20131203/53188_1 /TAXON_ID= /ORGANISM="Craspedostauros australis, Strain CCMP3328" /LENGTH=204 /DNA_ID=CAMNT_0043790659 /DNA_START=94 /DNA_END=708 /DNA_ORIENTATION=+
MTVHSFHIFDRKGKTLFTKNYVQARSGPPVKLNPDEEERLSEQRKLVFGMLFSLKEMCGNLSPADSQQDDVQMVKTGAACLYNFDTASGLKFALYATPETSYGITSSPSGPASNSQNAQSAGGAAGPASGGGGSNHPSSLKQHQGMTSPSVNSAVRDALRHIYEKIWVTYVVRSPMYDALHPDVASTNFEVALDHYLKGMIWFR